MNEAVERAAQCIWESYGEPLSHTEIARSAMLSRFHFARLFREATSVTPCRFLAAVRIYQAKHMLVTTKTSITDISFAVGYNSLGSFINHFTRSVGLSPGRFRQLALQDRIELPGIQPEIPAAHGDIAGTVTLPDGLAGARVYVGAFATPIVQHPMATAIVLDMNGERTVRYHLHGVPDGAWFVNAVGVADSADPEPWTERIALVGSQGPVPVGGGRPGTAVLTVRPRRLTDPPVLLAMPDLRPPLAAATVEPALGLGPAERHDTVTAAPGRRFAHTTPGTRSGFKSAGH